MKTHELARFLRNLADALSRLPDTDVARIPEVLVGSANAQPMLPLDEPKKKPRRTNVDIDELLSALSKKELTELIKTTGFPVTIRSRDSATDLSSKLINYLRRSPAAKRRVDAVLRRGRTASVSEPLSKALETLLRHRDEVSTPSR